jgi:hypothetical protein
MSHHYSGPDFGFPHGDAHLDLTDLYAFPKPGEVGKSILIMNVYSSADVKVTRDNVGPHTDLPTTFPYVGSLHKIRSAERVAA